MSNPQTFYTVGVLDLSGIFQPYTSGNNAVTGYKISSGQDLSGIFQPFISGNKAIPTNYFVYNYNNLGTKDLSDIFAPYNNLNYLTIIGGTYISSIINGIQTKQILSGTSGTLTTSVNQSNLNFVIVGGGESTNVETSGGNGGGSVYGTLNLLPGITYSFSIGESDIQTTFGCVDFNITANNGGGGGGSVTGTGVSYNIGSGGSGGSYFNSGGSNGQNGTFITNLNTYYGGGGGGQIYYGGLGGGGNGGDTPPNYTGYPGTQNTGGGGGGGFLGTALGGSGIIVLYI